MKKSHTPCTSAGFSLIEVVIAMAVVAVTATAILGVCGRLSTNTGSVIDRREASRVLDAFASYLRRSTPDGVSTNVPSFAAVQSWATTRQKLYAYRTVTEPDRISISTNAPSAANTTGKLFVAEIAPPTSAFTPASGNGTASKPYATMLINLFANSPGATSPVDPAAKLGTYPMAVPQ